MIRNLEVWIAWHLPKPIVVWCCMRVLGHATREKWTDCHPDDVPWFGAMELFLPTKKPRHLEVVK